MKIYLASDHAGFYAKEKIKENLLERGFLIEDFGANNFNESDDYPDFVIPCIEKYRNESNGDFNKGFAIVLGGSGTGEAICANRYKGIRAVVCNSTNLDIVKLGRKHNNANVLSIGAKFLDEKEILEAVKTFQTTPFEGGRHVSRLFKVDLHS